MDLKNQILSAPLPTKAVVVKEWKDESGNPLTVYIKTMNGQERMAWADVAYDDKGFILDCHMSRLLVHCLVDAEGKRIFADSDIPLLEAKHGMVLLDLWGIANDLNSLSTRQAVDAVKN